MFYWIHYIYAKNRWAELNAEESNGNSVGALSNDRATQAPNVLTSPPPLAQRPQNQAPLPSLAVPANTTNFSTEKSKESKVLGAPGTQLAKSQREIMPIVWVAAVAIALIGISLLFPPYGYSSYTTTLLGFYSKQTNMITPPETRHWNTKHDGALALPCSSVHPF